MGLFSSDENTKAIDQTSTVNNNVSVNGEVDVYSIEIVVLLGIICALKIIEFIYFIYQRHYRNVKKRWTNGPPQI